MLQFEQQAWSDGYEAVAGVDEAGRGPLAGPVVAASVLIDKDFLLNEADEAFAGLNDSKQLTEKNRELFFALLTNGPQIQYGICAISEKEIDQINILRATHKAMAQAIKNLPQHADFVLVDGRPVPGLPCPSNAIVKGDSKSLSIAAASVIAKVTRDHMMLELDKKYPQYGFAAHKGYGTAAHLEALKKHGPTPCHRCSFRPVREAGGELPPSNQLELF